MKVVVRYAHNRVTKTEMEREIERLFQENKDLRVSEGHLMDEVHGLIRQNDILRQQSEARRQVICERDQHIQELEESLEKNTRLRETSITKMAEIQTKLYEQMREAIDAGAEINIALMEAEATIDEQKNRIEWLEEEVARLTNERDTAVNENTVMTFDLNELQDKWEAEHNLRANAEKERDMYRSSAEAWHAEHDKVVADVALYREKAGKYLDERNRAWDTNKRLEGNEETITYYQEIAEKRKEKLDEAMRTITSLNNDIHELEETIDGLNEDKRAYGEEIDRLRKVVTELQTNRSLTNEIHEMLYKYLTTVNTPSADKLDF